MADAPAPIKCDHCGLLARRRLGHVCPDHWLYIESKVEHSTRGAIHALYACSAACAEALWRLGPGPAGEINEEGTLRMRKRDERLFPLTGSLVREGSRVYHQRGAEREEIAIERLEDMWLGLADLIRDAKTWKESGRG